MKYLRPAIVVATLGVIFNCVNGPGLLVVGFQCWKPLRWGDLLRHFGLILAVLKSFTVVALRARRPSWGGVADDIMGVVLLSLMISLLASTGIKAAGKPTAWF